MLRQALGDGAFCLSSGLIYPPGCYADVEELMALARELLPYGAFYETHMRDEGEGVVEALQEAIQVSRRSGAPLEVSHHKVIRKRGWQVHCKTTIALIHEARGRAWTSRRTSTPTGPPPPPWTATCPAGPLKAVGKVCWPGCRTRRPEPGSPGRPTPAMWAGGGTSTWPAATEKNQWTVGKSILEIAAVRGVDPADACFDLVLEERCRVGEINYGMCEEDIAYIMCQPYTMIGSDGNAVSLNYPGQPHPRWYGTFPRVIARYCRDRALLPGDGDFEDDRAPRRPPAAAGPGTHQARDLGRPGPL
ncbi:MAG: hypothetical protein V8R40_04100 [Dysosmobacter sp.]